MALELKSSILDIKNNLVINGDMRIAQRGNWASFTPATSGTYYMDQWKTGIVGVTASIQDVGPTLPNGLNARALYIQATSSATGYFGKYQFVEDYGSLKGRTFTLSAYISSNVTNAYLAYYVGGTLGWVLNDVGHTGNGQWEKKSITFTVPNDASTSFAVGYWISTATTLGSTPITSGAYIQATNIKLEFGSVATEFMPRPLYQELDYCERYYQKSYASNTYAGAVTTSGMVRGWGYGNGGSISGAGTSLRVRMRITPSTTFYDAAGNSNKMSIQNSGGGITDNVGINATTYSETCISARAYGYGNFESYFHYTVDAEM